MKYRQIETNFWEDSYILELTNSEKIFFIYLFTNDKVNLCGIYELPDRVICSTLGATLGELANLKLKMEKDNKYAFYKNWVYIVNFSDHNKYSPAPNVILSFKKDFNRIPKDVLNYFFNTLKLEYTPPIESKEIVIVMDKVIVKEGRGYPRGYPRIATPMLDERVNPEDIPL